MAWRLCISTTWYGSSSLRAYCVHTVTAALHKSSAVLYCTHLTRRGASHACLQNHSSAANQKVSITHLEPNQLLDVHGKNNYRSYNPLHQMYTLSVCRLFQASLRWPLPLLMVPAVNVTSLMW